MIFNDIRKMAKGMGVNTYRMKKADIIQSIQNTENNIECYGTKRVEYCNENSCIWRNDCLILHHKKG